MSGMTLLSTAARHSATGSTLDRAPDRLGPRARRAFDRAREESAVWAATGFAASSLARAEAATGAGPRSQRLRVAIGDPQAPLATFLEILDRNDLLADDGRLHPDVLLVSMGDHFDWGPAEARAFAAENSVRLLSWLAAHPAAQVVLLAGNHDLVRVGELAGFDDATFAAAHDEATVLRTTPRSVPGRAARRRAFLDQHHALPSVGVAARDWSGFEARQRALVGALIEAGRLRPAFAAAPDLLLVHAAITPGDLDRLGVPPDAHAEATAIAAALDVWWAAARTKWAADSGATGAPLDLEPLYRIGNAALGESRGIFVQRPADPGRGDPALFDGPPRRRFDPRGLAPGLAQVTGHIRDAKCRDLMPRWSDAAPLADGPLRHLWTDGRTVRYAQGLPDDEVRFAQAAGQAALLYFADGGMNHADPRRYELLDLDARRAVSGARGVRLFPQEPS